MVAQDLWNKRKDIMVYEDQQTDKKSELDQYKNYVLDNDSLVYDLIQEHNVLADEFEKEVEAATEHLQHKLQDIQQRKKELHSYMTYILLNDDLLSELTKDYNNTKDKWKSAITKYTVGLDQFVDSGELKDV
jgi:Mg2+ and Co2+ transporter CorA